jgi:uncharacterized protein (TIGR02677 family)
MSQIAVIPPGNIRVFAYVTTEKAPLYRAIMRVFTESNARFIFHLRPRQVRDQLVAAGYQDVVDQAEIDSALSQLSDWGNLEALPDTSDVTTVEDFYKQRYFFRLTRHGEAAQGALEFFENRSDRKGELRRCDLAEIRGLVRNLNQLLSGSELDSREVYRNLLLLRARFENLVDAGQEFMGSLQRQIDLQVVDDAESIAAKQRLIDYLQKFIGELVIASDDITDAVREIERIGGVEKLLQAAAGQSVADEIDPGPDRLNRAMDQWRSVWSRFRDWFISRPGCVSNSDVLRSRARESLPALLNVITSINDRLITRIDRSNDLRVLARWFMESPSEAHAHRLWRGAFGLVPSRHLIINDAVLDDYETHGVLSDTSWLDAPPPGFSSRTRSSGSQWKGGRISRIVDRTGEKQKLAAATYEEALRILRAQNRFVGGTRLRLSELGQLDSDEFDLLLEFLGETVTTAALSEDATEILSSDGSLRVKLQPTGDGQTAAIETSDGTFSGPDHWIVVERNLTEPEEVAP